MGHLVFSPLPEFANLAEAQGHAALLFAADALPDGAWFVALPFGPVAIFSDGTAREAEYVADRSGARKVVAL